MGWDCVFYSFDGYFGIECKPSVGEDYPSVLRQARSNASGLTKYMVVLAERLDFKSVPDEDVRSIFQSSGVLLVTVEEVKHFMAVNYA